MFNLFRTMTLGSKVVKMDSREFFPLAALWFKVDRMRLVLGLEMVCDEAMHVQSLESCVPWF